MKLAGVSIAFTLLILAGCQSANVEVVDLNQVLNELSASLTRLDAQADDQSETELVAIAAIDEKAMDIQQLMGLFADNLNKLKMIPSPISVQMVATGELIGFRDVDSDNMRDDSEIAMFRVQIDEDNHRLIASDGDGFYRDHVYDRNQLKYFSRQLIGTMLGRKQVFYAGRRAMLKPDFENLQMSPRNYYPNAVARARARKRS